MIKGHFQALFQNIVFRTFLFTVLGFLVIFAFQHLIGDNRGMNLDSNTSTQKKVTRPIDELYPELEARSDLSSIVLAGGCFWCMEGPFEHVEGVEEVVSGFAGGQLDNPTYEQVVQGNTGHREAVKIYYHPETVQLSKLLEMYWTLIDPTDDGGQFVDRGSQYTTAIYYMTDDEKTVAEESKNIKQIQLGDSKKIVTEILPFKNFYPADDYHQDFYIHSAERYNSYKNNSGRPVK